MVSPPRVAVSADEIYAADRDFIAGNSFILFAAEGKFYDYFLGMWKELQPPNGTPSNVPADAKWLPGPNGSQAFYRINFQKKGVLDMELYTDFRSFDGSMYKNGAMYADKERFVIIPRSDITVYPEQILSFIWPSTFLLNDGSMLLREQAVSRICATSDISTPINRHIFNLACVAQGGSDAK